MADLTSVKILADSIGFTRLTTLQVTFPRFILAEVNTHRAFSRNSASSRARPVEKMIQDVLDDPFVPERFPINQRGMSASEYIGPDNYVYDQLRRDWLAVSYNAVACARSMLRHNAHKQIVNRLLEPWLWHTAIISATEWTNFFELRCNADTTQPEFYKLACMMRDAMADPDQLLRIRPLTTSDWHLPLIGVVPEDGELSIDEKIAVSIARCARVSYLTHDGKRDIDADLKLYNQLKVNGHLSPFEHAATPTANAVRWANFKGWEQARYVTEAIPRIAY